MLDLQGLEDFLIQKSKINKDFIKDFFGFQKINEYSKYAPFTISLDDVVFWLETAKDKLKKTLVNSYLKLVDYKQIVVLPPRGEQDLSHGGHNKDTILLTPDCFKLLCMRSKTKKADKVRQYYVDLEKLIDEYKNIIIENQNKKINILEADLRKDIYPKGGHCYIFEETDELSEIYYRIGQSKDMTKRMATHNSSNAHKKIVIFKIKTNNIIHYESCLRSTMYDYRYKNNKDFYKLPFNKLKDAVTNCKMITTKFKNDKKIDNINQTGGKINIRKLDEKITKVFSKLSEDVMWNFYRNPHDAYYFGKKITNAKLNEKILPRTYFSKILLVPVHRSSEHIHNINLGYEPVTYKELFNILYTFYNKFNISLKELLTIPEDIDEYIPDAIKRARKGDKIKPIDLVGNLNRFEGIEAITGNIYMLMVGS